MCSWLALLIGLQLGHQNHKTKKLNKKYDFKRFMINIPGVAGAVLQTPSSLISLFTE